MRSDTARIDDNPQPNFPICQADSRCWKSEGYAQRSDAQCRFHISGVSIYIRPSCPCGQYGNLSTQVTDSVHRSHQCPLRSDATSPVALTIFSRGGVTAKQHRSSFAADMTGLVSRSVGGRGSLCSGDRNLRRTPPQTCLVPKNASHLPKR
jgi:hypothetical protein